MKLSDIRRITNILPTSDDLERKEQTLQRLAELGYAPGNFYQELEMSSRFVDTHRDVSYSSGSIQLHSHSFYEILYCRTTCGVEYLVGKERYRLQRGDIIIVAPGVSHRPLLPEQLTVPYKRYVLWINAQFLWNLYDLFPVLQDHDRTRSSLVRTAGTRWEFLGDLFRSGVLEAESHGQDWEPAVVANTVSLLIQLRRAITQDSATVLSAERPELLDRAMAYIEENLSAKLTLSDVARQLYVSESTISQTFRNKMGVSFHQCLTQRRLIEAKRQIQEGIPLENVSQAVGFPDYSTFYRAFKKEYGISPRQYRKLQEEAVLPDL